MIKRLKPELQKLASVPPPLPQQKTAYQLKLKNLAGESLNLESLKGKVIFLNFWGTMCGPCVAEMPSIQKLYDAVKNDPDIAVLVVSVYDQPDELKKFDANKSFTLPNYMLDGEPENEFKQRGIPATLIIRKDGTIELYKTGAADWGSPKVISWIKGLALK